MSLPRLRSPGRAENQLSAGACRRGGAHPAAGGLPGPLEPVATSFTSITQAQPFRLSGGGPPGMSARSACCAVGEQQTSRDCACPTTVLDPEEACLAGGRRPPRIPPLSALEDDAVEIPQAVEIPEAPALAQAAAVGGIAEPLAGFVTGGPGVTAEELEPGRARGRGRIRAMPTGWRQVALIGSISIVGPLCIDMYLPALPRDQPRTARQRVGGAAQPDRVPDRHRGRPAAARARSATGSGAVRRCWPGWRPSSSRRWPARWPRTSTSCRASG